MYRNMNTYAFTENRLIKKAAEAAFKITVVVVYLNAV